MTDRDANLCEAAMCLWEHVLSLIRDGNRLWRDWVEGDGYNHVRMTVLGWAPLVHADYEQVAETYDNSFDWDFVPEWIALNVIINDGTRALRVDRSIPGMEA